MEWTVRHTKVLEYSSQVNQKGQESNWNKKRLKRNGNQAISIVWGIERNSEWSDAIENKDGGNDRERSIKTHVAIWDLCILPVHNGVLLGRWKQIKLILQKQCLLLLLSLDCCPHDRLWLFHSWFDWSWRCF